MDVKLDVVTRERYRKATVAAIEGAFNSLESHEKLILLYYHVENLKLREISRLVENEDSPLRAWFQRNHCPDFRPFRRCLSLPGQSGAAQ